MLTFGAFFICSFYFIIRTRKHLNNLTKVFNVVAICLCAISIINIVRCNIEQNFAFKEAEGRVSSGANTVNSEKRDELPDIYYIILDRYASASSLKDFFNYDNSEFMNYLSSRGFYVASQSKSNYLQTFHSLASSLNMEYLDRLGNISKRKTNSSIYLIRMLQDYKVSRFLKSQGYKIIHIGPWWSPAIGKGHADVKFTLYPMPNLLLSLYATSMLYHITERLGILNHYYLMLKWKEIPYYFDRLAEIPNIKEPTFVFAHLLITHEPYVFGRNGEFLSLRKVNKRSEREDYLDQLIFANSKVKALINKLLSNSRNPPVIILQSDEGPYPPGTKTPNYKWLQASKQELKEKMGILNAYFLPNIDKSVLYSTITPVNSFRIVFNLYFNTNLALLPDESYIHECNNSYKFFNVTYKLKEGP
jgi:hypothetical protein